MSKPKLYVDDNRGSSYKQVNSNCIKNDKRDIGAYFPDMELLVVASKCMETENTTTGEGRRSRTNKE
jgi:hypothetical protein